MAQRIDKTPPADTGDIRRDLREIREYLYYLREQMNFILTQLGKEREHGEQD